MTGEASQVDRWLAFDPGELTVIQAALARLADDVQDQASRGLLGDADARQGAANTFTVAETMVFQIDDLAGREHPSLEVMRALAALIASGEYREVVSGNSSVPGSVNSAPIVEAA